MRPPIWVLRVASSEWKTREVVDQPMPLPARHVIPWILLPLHPQMWWRSCSILVIVFVSGLYHPCVIVLIVWAFLLWLHMCDHFVKVHALILSHFVIENAVLLTDTDSGLVWNQNLMKWFWEPRMFTCIHTGGQPLLFSVGKKTVINISTWEFGTTTKATIVLPCNDVNDDCFVRLPDVFRTWPLKQHLWSTNCMMTSLSHYVWHHLAVCNGTMMTS